MCVHHLQIQRLESILDEMELEQRKMKKKDKRKRAALEVRMHTLSFLVSVRGVATSGMSSRCLVKFRFVFPVPPSAVCHKLYSNVSFRMCAAEGCQRGRARISSDG